MLLAFSGDPFLVHRAARRALKARGIQEEEITELGEGMQAEQVVQVASQAGLFGQVALLLDFDVAFRGQAGVKPRNAVMKALETLPESSLVVVIDVSATASRQKAYKKLGDLEHLPTPRFDALIHWIRQELSAAGLAFERDVPQTLADLFGEDLPGIASEIVKLSVLAEPLGSERVRMIVNRPAARDAFDLIEAISQGDAAKSLAICQSLAAQGEAAARVLGALAWQYHLVARCVGLAESRAIVDAGFVAQTLKVKPFVAKKALAISKKLHEQSLAQVLTKLLEADLAMKTGKDEQWALESLTLTLCQTFQAKP